MIGKLNYTNQPIQAQILLAIKNVRTRYNLNASAKLNACNIHKPNNQLINHEQTKHVKAFSHKKIKNIKDQDHHENDNDV